MCNSLGPMELSQYSLLITLVTLSSGETAVLSLCSKSLFSSHISLLLRLLLKMPYRKEASVFEYIRPIQLHDCFLTKKKIIFCSNMMVRHLYPSFTSALFIHIFCRQTIRQYIQGKFVLAHRLFVVLFPLK